MVKLKGAVKAAFLARMAKGRANAAKKLKKSVKRVTKSAKSKRKNSPRKGTVAAKKSSGGRKGGTTMQTRLKKFAMGAGIGVLVALAATGLRRPEINQVAPIADAFVGAGVEGQIGTAAVRVVQQLLVRNGNGFGGRVPGGTQFQGA